MGACGGSQAGDSCRINLLPHSVAEQRGRACCRDTPVLCRCQQKAQWPQLSPGGSEADMQPPKKAARPYVPLGTLEVDFPPPLNR